MSLFTSSDIPKPVLPAESKKASKSGFEMLEDAPVQEVAAILEHFEFGKTYPFYTEGAFSIHQLVCSIIKQIGPARVWIASWTVTEEPLRALQNLKKKGLITHLSGLFDNRTRERNPRGYQFARGVCDSLAFMKSHAKIYLIESDAGRVSIVASANWSRNPRLEAGVILTDPDAFQFYHSLLTDKINAAQQESGS